MPAPVSTTHQRTRFFHRDATMQSALGIALHVSVLMSMVAFAALILIDGYPSTVGGAGEYFIYSDRVLLQVKPWVWFAAMWVCAIGLIAFALSPMFLLAIAVWRFGKPESFRLQRRYESVLILVRILGFVVIGVSALASVAFDNQIHKMISH